MRCMLQWVRSILFQIIFYSWTALLCILFIPTLLMGRKAAYLMPYCWTKSVPFILKWVCGIRIEVKGLENLPKENGYIIASKHQSALETLMFHPFVPNVFFVLKRELLWLPIAGLYAWRTDCVGINRSGGAVTMRKMLNDVQKNLKKGLNLVIFPEGTRTKPGTKKPYSPGVALLYEQCQVPVVPVAVNSGYFWPKNSVRKYPGTAVIEFLKPIPIGLHKRAFMNELYDRIEERQDLFEDPFKEKAKC